ncbi:MAG: hypothetical protein DYH12_17865 [Sorangiineae bacterium PRO1]|nr:hypothetical protein [Sorangiineae bacterium PRO1]
MIAVLVESNWVYEYCAPAHRRTKDAQSLVVRAEAGDIQLALPAICLREGADAVRRKCQPRLGEIREYRRLSIQKGKLSPDLAQGVSKFLEQFERDVLDDLGAIDERLDLLIQQPGIEVFGLDDEILARVLQLRQVPDVGVLQPFDESILAAVLVKAERLRAKGATDVRFCCLDQDLRPWTRKGEPKLGLQDLYAQSRVQFVDDLTL